jgi:DNA-binding Lrp family transcriptional regulator
VLVGGLVGGRRERRARLVGDPLDIELPGDHRPSPPRHAPETETPGPSPWSVAPILSGVAVLGKAAAHFTYSRPLPRIGHKQHRAGGDTMAIRGYVLIETEVGSAKTVGEAMAHLEHKDARVISVDTVTGPFDVIVQLEADDLDRLGNCITEGIQAVGGVKRTTTCLAVRLG